MKIKKNVLLFVGLLTILVLGACSSQAAVTTEVPVEVAATEAPAEVISTEAPVEIIPTEAPVEETATVDLSQLTDAEMEALIAEKAHDKHTLEFILSKDFTAEEWSATLDRMIGYGAKISPEEKEAIINWLVNR